MSNEQKPCARRPCAPWLLLEFDDSLFVVNPDAGKLPQDVLTKKRINASSHMLTGIIQVHHNYAPGDPVAIAKPEVHVAGDAITFGASSRFGRLQASELNRGQSRGFRADDRVVCASVEKQRYGLTLDGSIEENHAVDGVEWDAVRLRFIGDREPHGYQGGQQKSKYNSFVFHAASDTSNATLRVVHCGPPAPP